MNGRDTHSDDAHSGGLSQLRELFSATGWTVLGTGFGRLMVLTSMVLIARSLGPDQFGLLIVVQSTLAVLGLVAGGGLGILAIRSLSTHRTSDPDRAGRDLVLVASITVCLGALAVTGLILGAPRLADHMGHADPDQTLAAFQLGCVWLVVSAVRALQDSVLSGFEAFRQQAMVRGTEGLLTLLCVPTCTVLFGLHGAILGLAAVGAFAATGAMSPILAEMRRHRIVLRRPVISEGLLSIWSTSLPAFLGGAVAVPVLWAVLWDLARQSGPAEAGLYGAAYQWHGPLLFLPLAISSVSLPMLVRLNASHAGSRFRDHLITSVGLGFGIAALPALVAVLSAPFIVSLYGPEFQDAQTALFWVVAAVPCHAVAKLTSSGLIGRGHVWMSTVLQFGWASMFLVSYMATPVPSAGSVAQAFCLSYLALAIMSLAACWGVEHRATLGRGGLAPSPERIGNS